MANTTSVTFRCRDEIFEAIERYGRAHYYRDEPSGTAKHDYDRTAAIEEILIAGIAALEGGEPLKVRSGAINREDFEALRSQVAELAERLGKLRA